MYAGLITFLNIFNFFERFSDVLFIRILDDVKFQIFCLATIYWAYVLIIMCNVVLCNNQNVDRYYYWSHNTAFKFIGYETNMAQLIPSADIVCLPSYREGLSKFLIEAAACGKPIVTTNVPGCKEVVKDNWNGYVVAVQNSNALADALEALIASKEKREKFGKNSREIAIKAFSIESVIEQTMNVYQQILV